MMTRGRRELNSHSWLGRPGVKWLLALLLLLAGVLLADQGRDLGVYRVSAYCPCQKCCGPNAKGITADGTRVTPGAKLLAAPRSLPFGMVLSVPGYGEAVVHDRGGAIKGNRLDVFFWTHQAALNWGVRYLRVRRVTP